jgi:hypothetical protein
LKRGLGVSVKEALEGRRKHVEGTNFELDMVLQVEQANSWTW